MYINHIIKEKRKSSFPLLAFTPNLANRINFAVVNVGPAFRGRPNLLQTTMHMNNRLGHDSII